MRNEMLKKLEQEINNVKEAVEILADELGNPVEYSYSTNGTYTISTLINGVVYSVTESLVFAISKADVLTLFANAMLNGETETRNISAGEIALKKYIAKHEIVNMWVDLEAKVYINSEVYCNVSDFEGIFESPWTSYDIILFDTFLVKAKSDIFDEWLDVITFEVE